jgi:hypothetical protein
VWQTHIDYDKLVLDNWQIGAGQQGLHGVFDALHSLQGKLSTWGAEEFGSLARTVWKLSRNSISFTNALWVAAHQMKKRLSSRNCDEHCTKRKSGCCNVPALHGYMRGTGTLHTFISRRHIESVLIKLNSWKRLTAQRVRVRKKIMQKFRGFTRLFIILKVLKRCLNYWTLCNRGLLR